MGKVKYNKESGTLHIGFGRFFHAQKPVEVQDKDELLKKYADLSDAGEDNPSSDEDDPIDETEEHTESSLKKINADSQKELITELGGNVEDTSNENERIELILQLQEENQEQDKE